MFNTEKKESEEPLYPSRFNDPVAMQTEWTLTENHVGGRSSFHPYKLIKHGSYKLELRKSNLEKIFAVVPFTVGMIVALLSIGKGDFIAFAMSMPFILISPLVWRASNESFPSIFFDKVKRFCWKDKAGKKNQLSLKMDDWIEFDKIHALQLLKIDYVGGNDNDDDAGNYVYELNLVLKDSKRINIIRHGSNQKKVISKLQRQAKEIGDFLDKPVWDAT